MQPLYRKEQLYLEFKCGREHMRCWAFAKDGTYAMRLDLVTEYDLVTFTVIVGMWLTTICLAYRIGLQSVWDEHDEADRPQIHSFKIHLTSAEGLPTSVIVGQLHRGEQREPAVDLGQADVHWNPLRLQATCRTT